jgi:hypothetical protein
MPEMTMRESSTAIAQHKTMEAFLTLSQGRKLSLAVAPMRRNEAFIEEPVRRVPRAVAAGFYHELVQAGFERDQILKVITEMISTLNDELRAGKETTAERDL